MVAVAAWEDVVDVLGGVLSAVAVTVAVLGLGGAWIAVWALWRTRGTARKVE